MSREVKITFQGRSGSGKTMLARLVAHLLKQRGIELNADFEAFDPKFDRHSYDQLTVTFDVLEIEKFQT